MPVFPSLPAASPDGSSLASRCLFSWRAADARLTPLTGQTAAIVRAATATGTDAVGATVTFRNNQPAWSIPSSELGMNLTTADDVAWTIAMVPAAMSLYLRIRMTGFGYTATPNGIIGITNAGATGARLTLTSNGTNDGRLVATHNTGSSSVTSTLATGVASSTDAEYLITLASTGVVQLIRSVAGTDTTATASSTNALGAAWGTLALRASAHVALYDIRVLAGVRTLTECRECL
jgi:hypothetical protein